jgi:hypothetical protein
MGGEPRLADDGSPTTLPKSLGGISGSSIWLGSSERHLMDDWTPELAKVVGVQTKVYTERRVAQGTRWAGVALLLWENLPELHDALIDGLPEKLVRQFPDP